MSLRYTDHTWFIAGSLTERRLPLAGTFELSLACNLHCSHCYLRGYAQRRPDLSTKQVLVLLEQMAEAGCLSLSLTGGEPLLRDDFEEIWRRAHQSGFLLALFTNATRLTPRLADFLARHPPRAIEVSLYGASEETYAKTTGRAQAFGEALTGIDALRKARLPVKLKSVLQRDLVADAQAMIDLAEERDLQLRLDPGLDPRLNGDESPLSLRIDAEQAVALEMRSLKRKEDLRAYHQRWLQMPEQNRRIPCSAGHQSFHLDSTGQLMACLMLRARCFDALTSGFAAAWSDLAEVPRPNYPADSPCAGCALQHICSQCPAQQELGQRPPTSQADDFYHCRVAKFRAAVLD